MIVLSAVPPMPRITSTSSRQPAPRVVAATAVPSVSKTTRLSAITASDGRLSYAMLAAYAARISVELVGWSGCVAITPSTRLFDAAQAISAKKTEPGETLDLLDRMEGPREETQVFT